MENIEGKKVVFKFFAPRERGLAGNIENVPHRYAVTDDGDVFVEATAGSGWERFEDDHWALGPLVAHLLEISVYSACPGLPPALYWQCEVAVSGQEQETETAQFQPVQYLVVGVEGLRPVRVLARAQGEDEFGEYPREGSEWPYWDFQPLMRHLFGLL